MSNHCRHLDGFDFEHLTRRTVRDGSWEAEVPTVVGPVTAGEPFLVTDYELAQASTGRPVKMTVPGPMTIIDSTANAYYQSEPDLGAALATAINAEIRALVAAGCTQIQIDEPVMARYPQPAANYGFDLLAMALAGLDGNVTATIHICCGYPDRLDAVDYPKADPAAYAALLPLVETSRADVVSLEDAHRNNPLGIFESLKTTTVALGAVDIARSGVEATDAIADRVAEVLEVVDADRLMLAPDCGLGYLSRQVSIAKLRSMTAAARRF